MNFPDYLNKPDEVIENAGDLVVPEGTLLRWSIFTKDTREIIFKTDTVMDVISQQQGNVFKNSIRAIRDFN